LYVIYAMLLNLSHYRDGETVMAIETMDSAI